MFASDTSRVIGPTDGGGQGQIDLSGAGTPYELGSAVTSCGATSFAFTGTGSLKVPNGTTAQRGTAETGMLRWNTTDGQFEGYDGTAWGAIGGSVDLSAVAENIIPDADNTRDLGASGTRWANLYTGDLDLSNEGRANDVDVTWGSFLIQEGEEDLFLINRRSGKKYKFNLTEVN